MTASISGRWPPPRPAPSRCRRCARPSRACSFDDPSGYTLTMTAENNYVSRGVFIGSVNEKQRLRRALAIPGRPEAGPVQPLWLIGRGARAAPSWRSAASALACLAIPASAAPLDRAAFAAGLCGDAAAQVRGAEGLVQAGGALPADDLACAGRLLGALAERRLSCTAERRGPARPPGRARGPRRRHRRGRGRPRRRAPPVLGLRQRAAIETARGVVALLTGPDPAARAAGLAVLERRIAAVPEAVLDRARDAETDAGLKADDRRPCPGRRPVVARSGPAPRGDRAPWRRARPDRRGRGSRR